MTAGSIVGFAVCTKYANTSGNHRNIDGLPRDDDIGISNTIMCTPFRLHPSCMRRVINLTHVGLPAARVAYTAVQVYVYQSNSLLAGAFIALCSRRAAPGESRMQ